MTRYTVALRDPHTGRYGTAAGYKAGSPAEAVIRAIQGPRRRTQLTVADVEHLGGERYRVGERIYRVVTSNDRYATIARRERQYDDRPTGVCKDADDECFGEIQEDGACFRHRPDEGDPDWGPISDEQYRNHSSSITGIFEAY